MKIAVIPARGGSKRIPHKNVRPFCGKPMIAWSIEAAERSACFDRIIVSTDDDAIADVAREFGAEVPFMRPKELADDFTGTVAVIAHGVEWLIEEGNVPEYVCCLYATAPFVQEGDLRSGLDRLMATTGDYALSVTSFPFPVQRGLRIGERGRVQMVYPEFLNTRSQDLEEIFHDAGQFYWGRTSAWLERKPIFSDDAVAVPLPRYRVQDIDTLEDWERAEWIFAAMRAQRRPSA